MRKRINPETIEVGDLVVVIVDKDNVGNFRGKFKIGHSVLFIVDHGKFFDRYSNSFKVGIRSVNDDGYYDWYYAIDKLYKPEPEEMI